MQTIYISSICLTSTQVVRRRILFVIMCSHNKMLFGRREEALSSPCYIHIYILYIHTHLSTYIHTNERHSIKSSTIKEVNAHYLCVQMCRINMCKTHRIDMISQLWGRSCLLHCCSKQSSINSPLPGWAGSAAIRLALFWIHPAQDGSSCGHGLPTIPCAV